MLQTKNLLKLSSEILKVNRVAQLFYNKEKKEQAITFLICLDFLLKGVLIHWQIQLSERGSRKTPELMKGFDTKFPVLLGDQYHTMAYFMITRLGNVELTKLLNVIEENFWKIFYNLERISAQFEQNLKMIYQHFYNYLPQFFGNSFRGLGVIFNLSSEAKDLIKEAGVELGFFFQFGIFSYILTAVLN